MSIRVLEADEIRDLFKIDHLDVLADLSPQYDGSGCLVPKLSAESFGLEGLGCGSYASVIAHPEHAHLVIRVSKRTDGWVEYACGPANSLRPELHALGWTGDVWVAIAERLIPVPPEWEDDALDRVDTLLKGKGEGPEALAAAALMADAAERDLRFDDVAPRNIMMRANGDLVITDPMAEISDVAEAYLMNKFSIIDQDFYINYSFNC